MKKASPIWRGVGVGVGVSTNVPDLDRWFDLIGGRRVEIGETAAAAGEETGVTVTELPR